MDIRLFKTFLLVARLENITQAAERLNFTQPTVTGHIKSLEEHLGVLLFDRIGKKLFITNAGEQLISYAENLVNAYDATINGMRAVVADQHHITIGTSSNLINYLLTPAIQELVHTSTNSTLRIEICPNSREVVREIVNNQFDIGIVHDTIRNSQIRRFFLLKEQLIWVSHRDVMKEDPCIAKIKDYPIINFRIGCTFRAKCDDVLSEYGLSSFMEYNDLEAVKKAVEDKLGVALLPRLSVTELLEEGIFTEFLAESSFDLPLYIVVHKDKMLSREVLELLDTLARHLPDSHYLKPLFDRNNKLL